MAAKSITKQKIIGLIQKGIGRPTDLSRSLGISAQALHRHLKTLIESAQIIRRGAPPLVTYAYIDTQQPVRELPALAGNLEAAIEKNYAYLSPEGEYLLGLQGFQQWLRSTGQLKAFKPLALAYEKQRSDLERLFVQPGYTSALNKFKSTFPEIALADIFYKDFYSLPQFGRTKTGILVTIGKSGQKRWAIQELARETRTCLEHIIKTNQIDTIGFLPHSVSRHISFLKEYRRYLDLQMPEIKIRKAYAGQVPVAQKSLSKLSERIANARNTIFIDETKISDKSILLIDDAVGSGASLQETAAQLKAKFSIQKIYGFAIAGSYKGFEVISEI